MNLKNTLLIFFLITSLMLFSQNNYITIVAKLDITNQESFISYEKPIDKFPRTFYIDSLDNTKFEDGEYSSKIKLDKPGFIYLYEKPYYSPSIRFFAEPGEEIQITRQNGFVVFEGENAALNNLYNSRRILPSSIDDYIENLLQDTDDEKEILKKIELKTGEMVDFYKEMFNEKAITETCYNYIKAEVNLKVYTSVARLFEWARNSDFINKHRFKISPEKAQNLVEKYNTKCNTYTEESIKSTLLNDAIFITAWNMEYVAKKKGIKTNRFWNQFDAVFSHVSNNFGVIDFIESDEYKEFYVANTIFAALKFNAIPDEKVLIPVFKAFLEKFPNSKFINPLLERLLIKDTLKSTLLTPQEKSFIGNLTGFDSSLGFMDKTTFAQSGQNFLDALILKFPNQNLFIDCWATYCAPCIKQFSYNEGLHSFLASNNIKTLYVTVDNEISENLWQKLIKNYNLNGYHFYPNEKYREKHLMPILQYVPRYFVYNSKTKELIRLEGYPSDTSVFHNNILKSLK